MEAVTPFPGLLHFSLYPYLLILSIKQGRIKYDFWVSGMIHTIYIYIYILLFCPSSVEDITKALVIIINRTTIYSIQMIADGGILETLYLLFYWPTLCKQNQKQISNEKSPCDSNKFFLHLLLSPYCICRLAFVNIYIYIYIYCHQQTECFVVSNLFSVARHALSWDRNTISYHSAISVIYFCSVNEHIFILSFVC